MKIASMRALRIQIPFRKKFKHSLHERLAVETRLSEGSGVTTVEKA